MKRTLFAVLLSFFILSGLSAKTAFVYFSTTGNTARMAKNGAKAVKADVFEIHPEKKYTKDVSMGQSNIEFFMPFKNIRDGFIEYNEYYAGVLQIDPK